MADKWVAGKTYVPGALVRPVTAPPVSSGQPTNPSFESGTTGWTFGAGFTVTSGAHYEGSSSAEYNGSGVSTVISTDQRPVTPGQTITASCMVQQGASSSGKASGEVFLQWYDENHNFVGQNEGNSVISGSGGDWKKSSVTAKAPAGAAFVAIAGAANKNSSHPLWLDAFEWNYNYFVPAAGLVYKAVQPAPGKSGSYEPDWPPVLGQQVIDNQVIWEAVSASQIVWTARPVNKSGAVEPIWPTATGGTVHDGSIDWEATTPRITDPNCPQTKIVAIAASKVYAGDDDIIRYSATVNPLDWTSEDDAGYLPYGLQNYGSNPVKALGLYRSNLVAFNAEGFQMWQVDEDPASIALLDALPVGSTQHLALAPVSNDLFFLSSQGVRSMGIAAGSTNLKAGDVGIPIDQLVQEAINAGMVIPLATYVPSLGQYLLAFSNYNPDNLMLRLTGTLAPGEIGTPYSSGLTALGGTPPYVLWEITEGTLPDGLTINAATGLITGTPTS